MKKLIVLLSLVCVANLVSAQWNYYCPPPDPSVVARQMMNGYNSYMNNVMRNGWNNYPSNSVPAQIVVPDNSPSNSSSSTTSNEYKRKKKRCQRCNGSGTVIDYCTGFGNTKWCSKCGKEVSDSHYHTTCPSCKGAGEW